MKPINKLDIKFDIEVLKRKLECSELFGEHQYRAGEGSPHREMVDIWVRYKDPKDCIASGDFSSMAKEHESVWLKDIKEVKSICEKLMSYLDGEKLGGVLITKLPPKGKIYPHIDSGWHASYYDKYFVPIKNSKGAVFCFNGASVDSDEGDVYAFRNDVPHWVENNSKEDRIAMIICVKQSKLSKEGLCLGDMQQQQQ